MHAYECESVTESALVLFLHALELYPHPDTLIVPMGSIQGNTVFTNNHEYDSMRIHTDRV